MSANAYAGINQYYSMTPGVAGLPPAGYVQFCRRKPEACGADRIAVLSQAAQAQRPTPMTQPVAIAAVAAGSAADSSSRAEFQQPRPAVRRRSELRLDGTTPVMGPGLWSLLNRIDDDINHAIRPQSDSLSYGVDDYWTTPLEDGVRVGDCEDFALEKQKALLAAGVPRSALNLAVVVTPAGLRHAVLLVSTTDGEFVLDNLSVAVARWDQTPYRWVSRQWKGEAFNWTAVNFAVRPQVTRPSLHDLLLAAAR